MSEEIERPKIHLKDGSEVDARSAFVEWRVLTAISNLRPQHLKFLFALAKTAEVSKESQEELHQQYLLWVDQDGKLDSVVQRVLLSGCRETPDGLAIVNPFALKTAEEVALIDQLEKETSDHLRRLIPNLHNRNGREGGRQ